MAIYPDFFDEIKKIGHFRLLEPKRQEVDCICIVQAYLARCPRNHLVIYGEHRPLASSMLARIRTVHSIKKGCRQNTSFHKIFLDKLDLDNLVD